MRKGLKLIKDIRSRVDNLREDLDVALDPGLTNCDMKQMADAAQCIIDNANRLRDSAFALMMILNMPEDPANNPAETRDLSEVLR